MRGLASLAETDRADIVAALALPTTSITNGNSAYDPIVPLGTRTLMVSLFTRAFGTVVATPTADDLAIQATISNDLRNQVGAFGNPCRRTDDSCPGGEAALPINSTAQMLPTSNVVRFGYQARACEEILSHDGAVTNALSHAGLSPSSAASDANLQSLYQLFFPADTASPPVLTALANLNAQAASQGMSPLDTWRYTLVPLCKTSALGRL